MNDEESEFLLVIGDKISSSWSMRAWLMLKQTGVAFEEKTIQLGTAYTKAEISKYSPSGKVPLLKHNGLMVWESLAIGEYLNELFPEAKLWPQDQAAQAHARCISNEMHAGFPILRKLMPFAPNKTRTIGITPELDADIKRLEEIWTSIEIYIQKLGLTFSGNLQLPMRCLRLWC